MDEIARITIDPDGVVIEAEDDACHLLGIPCGDLVGRALTEHLLEEHRARLLAEISVLLAGEEERGRVFCTFIGADQIGRRVAVGMTRRGADRVAAELSRAAHADATRAAPGAFLSDPARLLPVARRVSGLARRAKRREDLLEGALPIFAEMTGAVSGVAVEWGGHRAKWPIVARIGEESETPLASAFRPAIVERLTRGDLVVKSADPEDTGDGESLVLVPLLSGEAPEGVFALRVKGYSVLVPQEQQSLEILGEIVGLGLRALAVASERERGTRPIPADVEAAIALGHLSAGLAHGINNAATVLGSDARRTPGGAEIGRAAYEASRNGSAEEDAARAVENIRSLTAALKAFAPEETSDPSEEDLLRTIETVVASMRFYAKRSASFAVAIPGESEIPAVLCRPNYLVRSLFLIFVELVDAAVSAGRRLAIEIRPERGPSEVLLDIAARAEAFSVPAVLLAQIEPGGAVSRNVKRAGAELSHEILEGGLSLSIALPIAADQETRERSRSHAPGPVRRGTILLVEHDPAVIRSLRRGLQSRHDVLAARTAAEGLGIVRSRKGGIDIVLVDLLVPGVSPRVIREEIARMHLPLGDRIVFLSGGAESPEAKRYLEETSCPVMAKPFDPADLEALIASLMG